MKHVVITGGSRGIGYALAREFLELGCRVTIAGRSESSTQDASQRLLSDLPAARERISARACDVSQSSELEALWTHASALAPVDVWINNAGVSPRFMRLWELTAEELRDTIDTNVSGVMLGSWVAMRGMRAQGHGMIYNIVGFGSDGTTFPGTLPYGASKRTVSYLSKALAREAKGSPVKVCTLDPCGVRTEMTAVTWSAMGQANPVMGAMIDILALDPPACARLLAPRVLANTRSGALIRPWNAGVFWLRTLTLPVLALLRLPGAKASKTGA